MSLLPLESKYDRPEINTILACSRRLHTGNTKIKNEPSDPIVFMCTCFQYVCDEVKTRLNNEQDARHSKPCMCSDCNMKACRVVCHVFRILLGYGAHTAIIASPPRTYTHKKVQYKNQKRATTNNTYENTEGLKPMPKRDKGQFVERGTHNKQRGKPSSTSADTKQR